jgi:hypothetical protein
MRFARILRTNGETVGLILCDTKSAPQPVPKHSILYDKYRGWNDFMDSDRSFVL